MNIVFISLDCVRPDYIGCYSDKNDTPFLKTALEKGFVFKNCISQASHTTTSHSSMFTGLYPFNHKVRWVSGSEIYGDMIQEVLKKKGYRTAAFIGGWTMTHKAFSRGFDLFHTDYTVEDTTEGRHIYNPIDNLVDLTLEHLGNHSDENNYVFIHSFDAHFTSRSDKQGKRKERYMEEIRRQDSAISRLYDYMKENDHLLVVTADHGDKLEGEHGYPYVYNTEGEKVGIHFHETEIFDIQLRVPFIAFGNRIKTGTDEGLCRSIDLAATILGHVGYSFPEKINGLDLSPIFQGGDVTHPEHAYSETYHAQLVEENRYAVKMSEKYEWGWKAIDNVVSLRNLDWKLICTANGLLKPAYLFNLKNDPKEQKNLIDDDSYQEVEEELFDKLKAMLADDDQYLYGSKDKESKSIKKLIGKGKLKGI